MLNKQFLGLVHIILLLCFTSFNIASPKTRKLIDGEGSKFVIDKSNKLGQGASGAVYSAKNKKTGEKVLMKKTTNKIPKLPVYRTQEFRDGLAEDMETLAKKENNYNKIAGLSAGEPTVIAKKDKVSSYIPMKRVQGKSVFKELQNTKPGYIPSKMLLDNSVAEINRVNHVLGIHHNDAHAGNLIVNEHGKVTAIDYGSASLFDPNDKKQDKGTFKMHLDDIKKKKQIPRQRQISFDEAYEEFLAHLS